MSNIYEVFVDLVGEVRVVGPGWTTIREPLGSRGIAFSIQVVRKCREGVPLSNFNFIESLVDE